MLGLELHRAHSFHQKVQRIRTLEYLVLFSWQESLFVFKDMTETHWRRAETPGNKETASATANTPPGLGMFIITIIQW